MKMQTTITEKYLTTKDLCNRYSCSSRTLLRWMERKNHPFPKPRLTSSGSSNRWAIEDIAEWEHSESQKTAA